MPRLLLSLLTSSVLACGSAAHSEVAAASAPHSKQPAAAAPSDTSEPAENAAAPPAQPLSQAAAAVDPALFDRVLAAHVRAGRVDYAALKRDAKASKQLDDFLAQVEVMPDDAPLAAWLNAYNALVIKLVLERYPLQSVMDVPDFFKALKRPVAGKPRSLDEIENGLIRPRFKDARVHVALNCGALSCPALRSKAFRQGTLDADLDALARGAVANPQHVALEGGKLVLSEIFFWFEADFVRDAGSVVAWVKRYTDDPKLQALDEHIPRAKRPYNWALADAARR